MLLMFNMTNKNTVIVLQVGKLDREKTGHKACAAIDTLKLVYRLVAGRYLPKEERQEGRSS